MKNDFRTTILPLQGAIFSQGQRNTIFLGLCFINEVSKNRCLFTTNRIHPVEKLCRNAKLCLHNIVVLDQCRELEFPATLFFFGERLIDHGIRTIEVIDKDSCELSCYIEHNCVSINFKVEASLSGKHNCDLNKATHKENENDLVKAAGYIYHGTIVRKPYEICVLRNSHLYQHSQVKRTVSPPPPLPKKKRKQNAKLQIPFGIVQ